jgi:hypothetical protein
MATPSSTLLDALGQNQDDDFSYLSPELRRQMRLRSLIDRSSSLLSPSDELRFASQPSLVDSVVKSAQQPLQKTNLKTRLTRSLSEPSSVFEKAEPTLMDRALDAVSGFTAQHPNIAQSLDEWFRPEAIPEDATESEVLKHIVKTPVLPPVVTKPLGRGLYSALSGDWMLPNSEQAHEQMQKDFPRLAAFGEGTKDFFENGVGGLLTPQNIGTALSTATPAGPFVVGAQIPEMVGSTIESGQKFGKSLSEGDVKGATSSGLETLTGGLMTLLGTGYAAKGLAGANVRPKPTAESFTPSDAGSPSTAIGMPTGIELAQNKSTGVFERPEVPRPQPSPTSGQGEILGSGLGSLQKFFEKTGDQLKLENAEKIAKKSGKKISEVLSESGEPFSPDLYADAMTRQRDIAREGSKTSLRQRTQDFLREVKANLVDNLSPIEDALEYSMKKGKDQFTVLPRYRFKNQVGRVLQSGAIAKDFAHRYGLFDVINGAKDGAELSRLGQYMIARHHVEVAKRGGDIPVGRKLLDDVNMLNAYDEQNPKFKQLSDQVSQYSQKLLQLKRDSGLISADSYDRLKEMYPNYVPFDRVFAPEETPSGRGSSEAAASLSSTTAQRKLKGSGREIDDPFVSLLAQTGKTVHEAEVNKAAGTIVHSMTFPDNPLGVVPLRTAERVKARVKIFQDLEATAPIRNIASKIISKYEKEIGRVVQQSDGKEFLTGLRREIDQLERSGLEHALSQEPKEVPAPLTSSIETKVADYTPKLSKQSAHLAGRLKEAEALLESLNTEGYKKALRFHEEPLGGLPRGRYKSKALIEQLIPETPQPVSEVLSKISKQEKVVADLRERLAQAQAAEATPEKISYETNFATTKARGPQSAKAFIESFVQLPDKEIAALQSRITRKKSKLGKMVGELAELKDAYSDLMQQRGSQFDEAKLLADAKSKGKATISHYNDGIKEIYQVEPWVEEAAKRMNAVQLGLAERMINLSSKLSKMGMTGLNVPFVGSNYFRDIPTAFVNAPSWRASIKSHPLLSPITTVKSFMDVIGHGEWMKEMDRQGASYSLMDLSKEALPKNIKDVRRRSGLRILSYPLHSPLATLEHFIGSTEKVTRQNIFRGEFERWKKEGMNDEDAKSMAAEAARRTTAPFERRGNYGRALNALMLFAGADIQGSRATVGALKDRPFSTTAKWTMSIAIPTIIATLYNLSDEKRKAIYQKLDPFEKENSQILIGPDAEIDPLKKVATGVLKLPMTPNLAKSTTIIRQLIEHYYADAPAPTIRQALDAALGAVTPLSTQANDLLSKFTPQPIKPALEVYTNKNFFTNKPIVPNSLKDAPPAEQAYPWTSGTAKQIGGLLGTSPLNVEHVIQGHGGGVGMQLLHFADQLQNLVRPADKQVTVGGQSILDSFKRRLFQASARSLAPEEQREVDQMNKYNALSKGEDFELKKSIRDKAARQIEAATKSPENKQKLESALISYFNDPAEAGSLEDREMKETRKQYSRVFGAPATGYFHTLKPDAKANYLFFEKAFEKIKELPAESRHAELEKIADLYGVSDSVLNRMLDLDDEMVKGKIYLNKIKPPSIDERIEKQQNKK